MTWSTKYVLIGLAFAAYPFSLDVRAGNLGDYKLIHWIQTLAIILLWPLVVLISYVSFVHGSAPDEKDDIQD